MAALNSSSADLSSEEEECGAWRDVAALSLRGRKATCIPPVLFCPSLGLAASLQTLDLGKNELAETGLTGSPCF